MIFFISALIIAVTACKKSSKNQAIIPETTQDANIDIQILTQNLTYPWELLWGPDNFIWMTERGGKISRVNPDNGTVNIVFTVPDAKSVGEGGLLGMVLHPSFTLNPHVFVAYNYDKAGTYTEK